MEKVAVIIPFYRELITEHELIALQQCKKVLSAHPVIAIKPHGLTMPKAADVVNFAEVKSFEDHYFSGSLGYNRLMLSSEFYEQFLNYEYILIYQLDAFIFSDQLLHWCNQGFDYIGAPWIRPHAYGDKFKAFKTELKINHHIKKNVHENGVPSRLQRENRVGNGGFSLRRVTKFHYITQTRRPDIEHYLKMVAQEIYEYSEDVFWSIEVNRKGKYLNIPSYTKAIGFAFETFPNRALEINNQQLPFGCHAWDRHIEFWAPYFLQQGYKLLPDELINNFEAATSADIKYLYRISDGSNPKYKLSNATKLYCLQNFINVFKHNIYVFADNCSDETINKLYDMGIKPVKIGLGNSKSWRFVVDSAINKFDEDSYVYLVEDDYLHLPGSAEALWDGLQIADYVTLYDHPDKYENEAGKVNNHINPNGMLGKVLLSKTTHWKVIGSTTMTFAAKVKTLKEDKAIWWHFTENKIPEDHQAFLTLTHHDTADKKKISKKLKAFFKGHQNKHPKRTVISSVPGFSTHAETDWLSPVTKWHNFANWNDV